MKRFLAWIVVLELLVAGGYFVNDEYGDEISDAIRDLRTDTSELPTQVEVSDNPLPTKLRPDQVELTGTVTQVVADHAVSDALRTPYSVEATERGVTRAEIVNAVVSGKKTVIHWDGGRPLPISGNGGIDLGSTNVRAQRDGIVWSLEGVPRALLPGAYRANFTVAVGSSGIGSVRDGVNFEAVQGTALQVSRGGAFVKQAPRDVHLQAGEPGSATFNGEITVRTNERTAKLASVRFGPGLYDIKLTPVTGGYRIEALLQGPLQA